MHNRGTPSEELEQVEPNIAAISLTQEETVATAELEATPPGLVRGALEGVVALSEAGS